MSERNREIDTHEVPTYKYLYFSGVAIHKRFFLFWTLFMALFTLTSTVIAVYTTWWQTLITQTLTGLFITYPYIGWPLSLGSVVVGYVWYKRRQKRLKKEHAAKVQREKISKLLNAE